MQPHPLRIVLAALACSVAWAVASAEVGEKPFPKVDGGSLPDEKVPPINLPIKVPGKPVAIGGQAKRPAPGPLDLRDMPVELSGGSGSRPEPSADDPKPSAAAQLRLEGGITPACRPGEAARSRGLNATNAQRTARLHNPALAASQCLSLHEGPTLFGGLVNTCDYPVDVVFCNEEPIKNSWADAFSCERQAFGAATIQPYQHATLHTHQANITHWAACKAPEASVKHAPWTGGQITYWCMADVREDASGSEQPAPANPADEGPNCRPVEQQKLDALRSKARRQAEKEKAEVERAWARTVQWRRAELERVEQLLARLREQDMARKDLAEGRTRPTAEQSAQSPPLVRKDETSHGATGSSACGLNGTWEWVRNATTRYQFQIQDHGSKLTMPFPDGSSGSQTFYRIEPGRYIRTYGNGGAESIDVIDRKTLSNRGQRYTRLGSTPTADCGRPGDSICDAPRGWCHCGSALRTGTAFNFDLCMDQQRPECRGTPYPGACWERF